MAGETALTGEVADAVKEALHAGGTQVVAVKGRGGPALTGRPEAKAEAAQPAGNGTGQPADGKSQHRALGAAWRGADRPGARRAGRKHDRGCPRRYSGQAYLRW